MKAYLSFSVSGYYGQEIEITKPGLTAEKLQEMLNNGEAWTASEVDVETDKCCGGKIIIVETDEVIGKVLNVENCCEYDDFVVEADEEN